MLWLSCDLATPGLPLMETIPGSFLSAGLGDDHLLVRQGARLASEPSSASLDPSTVRYGATSVKPGETSPKTAERTDAQNGARSGPLDAERGRMRLACSLSLLVFVSSAGCGESPSSTAQSSASALGADGGSEASCYGVFRWLQKDAYASTAGRTSDAWPPHTATQLDIHCLADDGSDAIIATAPQANHGTAPGTVDANGTELLVETKRERVDGTRADLLALIDAYGPCTCDPATAFLSLDSAPDDVMQQVLMEVQGYLRANLTCSDGVTPDQVATAIANGDYDDAIQALGQCAWNDGASMADGLTAAAKDVLQGLGKRLTDYHVCNNDAMLQARLFESFARTGVISACDATADVCHGPIFYYAP